MIFRMTIKDINAKIKYKLRDHMLLNKKRDISVGLEGVGI